MKVIGVNSNSNLIFVVEFQLNPGCYKDLAYILVQGDLVLDYICSEKYGTIFTIARPFFDT